MFERYTEMARRVVFFARYEASQFGSHYIKTEHLLLGLLREDKHLSQRVFPPSHAFEQSVRRVVTERTPVSEKVSTSVDMPLSMESRRVLTYAAEEAEQLKYAFISPDHILLGLLREQQGLAAEILAPLHLDIQAIREQITDPASSPLEALRNPAAAQKHYGKFRGVVVANMDPQQLGRLLARVPAMGSGELNWATPCIPFPAAGIPTLAVPAIGTSVWIEFEGGDLEYPIWSGCFWNADERPLLRLP